MAREHLLTKRHILEAAARDKWWQATSRPDVAQALVEHLLCFAETGDQAALAGATEASRALRGSRSTTPAYRRLTGPQLTAESLALLVDLAEAGDDREGAFILRWIERYGPPMPPSVKPA